ncbi:hypothetical protein MLD38_040342 [Melastoma candidum]|uniref:Uncharacterized protein n=1 Tax=Melastoma candidum TaxID=119954 RepID=A0ACB9L618_9MYRT|nr:hypothetical protein MLD38_040342 [Melastoma candidum]
MWWESYLRGSFWGELRSTQTCEGMHWYMKGYVKSIHKLDKFLHHYDRAVSDLRHKELQADYENGQRRSTMTTVLKHFEEHASSIYIMQSFRSVEALCYISASHTKMLQHTYDIVEYDNPRKVTQVLTIVGLTT